MEMFAWSAVIRTFGQVEPPCPPFANALLKAAVDVVGRPPNGLFAPAPPPPCAPAPELIDPLVPPLFGRPPVSRSVGVSAVEPAPGAIWLAAESEDAVPPL